MSLKLTHLGPWDTEIESQNCCSCRFFSVSNPRDHLVSTQKINQKAKDKMPLKYRKKDHSKM